MAHSGSFNSSAYDGRYYTISWKIKEQSIENNASSIEWTITANGGRASTYAEIGLSASIGGKSIYANKNLVNRSKGTVATGTITLTHNNLGALNIEVSLVASLNTTGNMVWHGKATYDLTSISQIATITSAYNFNDTNTSLWVSYSNPTEEKIDICIANTDGIEILVPYQPADATNDTALIILTEDDIQALIGSVKEGYTNKIRYYIRTTINNKYYLKSLERTFTITDAAPVIDVYVSSDKAEYTGSPTRIIKGESQIYYSINKAEALKQATVKSVEVKSRTYNSKDKYSAFIPNYTDDYLDFIITDSRNNKTTKRVNFDVVDYFKPTCAIRSTKTSINDEELTINIEANGVWFNSSFGKTINSFGVSYRYKEVDGEEYSSWTPMESSTAANDYTSTGSIAGLDYRKSYVVQCRIIDGIISEARSDERTVTPIPTFDWSGEDFAFNVPVSIEGYTIADYPIELGTEAMGSNGTWYWRKYRSGKAECWGTRNYGNMGVSTAWGSLYCSENFSQSLPSGLFIASPDYLDIQITKSGRALLVCRGYNDTLSANSTDTFCAYSPSSGTASQVYFTFYAVGRWK